MFKWLKKVMISIINAIKSLFVGDTEIQKVTVGDTVVYAKGVITYQISGTPWIEYSSGHGYISASGNDYARVVGTLITYVDGVEQGSSVVEFSPTLLSGDSGVWSISNNHIFAAYRGTTAGDARTATFSAVYSENGFTYTCSQTILITQQANVKVFDGSEVTSFEISDGGDEYVDGDTITFEGDVQQLTVNLASGVRKYSWTSGADEPDVVFNMSTTTNFWQYWELVNLDNADWITFGTGSDAKYITISQYTGSTSRSARISFRDRSVGDRTESMPTITINQTANEWELSAANATFEGTITQPTVTIMSKHYGSVYTNLAVTIVSSTISNLQYSGCSGSSNGQVTLNFTCGTNSGSSNKTASIRIYQNGGGNTRTITLTQKPFSSAFDGIDIKFITEDGQWVLGEITETGTGNIGFIVAKNTNSPLRTGTYNFSASFEYRTATGPNEFEGLTWYMRVRTEGTDVVLTDPRGTDHQLNTSRIFINNKSYYGCWVWDNTYSGSKAMSPDYTPRLVEMLDDYVDLYVGEGS